jgi:uncharacterized protein (DUF488 family)
MISVGHSNKSLTDFLALLRHANVRALVDIRRRPRSRWPQFNRPSMERALREHDIDYTWLGDALGGFRDGGYAEHMRTADFQRGIEELEALAEQRPTLAFMCSEGEPWKCHRRFVAHALLHRGHSVHHLLPDGSLLPEDPQLALPDL